MPTHGDITPRGRATPGKARAGLSLYALALCAIAACDTSCKSELIVSYEHADGSDHPPPLPAAPSPASDITREQALEVYQRFRDACVRKDAQAVWDLLDDSTRQSHELIAARFRAQGRDKLRSIGFIGPVDQFGAFELHRTEMEVQRPLNRCLGAQTWGAQVIGPNNLEYMLVVVREPEPEMGFFLRRDAQGQIRIRPTISVTRP